MKHSVFAAFFLAAAPVLMAQTDTGNTPDRTGPTITISTPAINARVTVNITGTATDAGGSTASPAGVRAVYYKEEGSSSWKKAKLSTESSTATTRTWMATVKINVATGKRVYFRAIDRSGNEGDVVGRRFRFGSS